jgi:hypothetical protein
MFTDSTSSLSLDDFTIRAVSSTNWKAFCVGTCCGSCGVSLMNVQVPRLMLIMTFVGWLTLVLCMMYFLIL